MGEIIYQGKPIICEAFLFGVKYWAQWVQAIPRYEIYHYLGHDKERKHFYFQSRRTRLLVEKKMDELIVGGFKPFLLDITRLKNLERTV